VAGTFTEAEALREARLLCSDLTGMV